MPNPDDAIERALTDGQQFNTMLRIGLMDMWDQIERILKRPVRFLTEQQREALR
ncbi:MULTISPECIES: hypothetical protein [Microbacterium]|uniref:hypothetical protein n=1 Tax=Microbacterium TaxID=33882 RepID=UPI0028EA9912|nr:MULTISPECIES: hypothetical protein [Microbacterium]